MDSVSVHLPRRNVSEGSLASSTDRKYSPFLAKRHFSSNSVLTSVGSNIPVSASVAKSVSRGIALPDQIALSRYPPRRSADTVYPSLSRDTNLPHSPLRTPPRTPILSTSHPTFRRPHSNPNLSLSKQYSVVSTDDVIETEKNDLLDPGDTALGRINRSAPSVERSTTTTSAMNILQNNLGIHSYTNLKTSTPNDLIRFHTRFGTQEITTPIVPHSAIRPDYSESTLVDQKSTELSFVKPFKQPILSEEYLQSIRDLLAEKPPYLLADNRRKLEDNSKNIPTVEIPSQIRAHHSEGATPTPRHNSNLNLSAKSTSMTTLMSVLEDLKLKNSKQSLETKPPNPSLVQSNPFLVNVARATSEHNSKDTLVSPSYAPQEVRRVSSGNLQSEDSFQILSTDQITEVPFSKPNLPKRKERNKSLSESSLQNDNPPLPETSLPANQISSSVQMSASSSASFIKLSSEMYLDSPDETPEKQADVQTANLPEITPTQPESQSVSDLTNKQCELVNNKHNKQSHALAITTNKLTNNTTLTPLVTPQSLFPEPASPYPRFEFSDFATPPTPSAFITDLDSQESLPSLEPRTIDCDTTLVPKISGTNNFPLEKIPSHYRIELLNSDSDSETFLPLTPSEVHTQPDTPPRRQLAEPVERELEIVSLPQSSVTSPNKQFIDTSSPDKSDCEERSVEEDTEILLPSHDAARMDNNHESSLEYLNRFVEEVRQFMDRRSGEVPQNISKEIQVTLNDTNSVNTSPTIPPNIDQLITEIAREKLDSLWEDYIQNKIALPHAPFLTPRKNTNLPHITCESTFSGYNTRVTSSFSDTTLFVPKNFPGKLNRNKIHLAMKPHRRSAQRFRREGVKKVSDIPAQTNPITEQSTMQVPDNNVLSVKRNSVAFLISSNGIEIEKHVQSNDAFRASVDMSLQEACQSFNPRFVTNSHLRQVELQKLRVWRKEMAQQINSKPTANKSIQTLSNGRNSQLAGSFIAYKRKLGPDEIQRQNIRWRKKFPVQKRRDEAKIQRQRAQQMRIRVKAYQREILDPVRKSMNAHS